MLNNRFAGKVLEYLDRFYEAGIVINTQIVLCKDINDGKILEKTIKDSVNGNELTVIIAKAPCALLKGQKFPYVCKCDENNCKKCGMCLKIGCPAITKQENGTIKIDETMCNGCGLCKSYCKFNAINKVER